MLSLRGNVSYFWIPEQDITFVFGYFGPKWQPVNWIDLMPQVGIVYNWHPDARSAFLVSLWINMNFFDGQLGIFLEGDAYLAKDLHDYYGFYSVDYNPLKFFGIGLHLEQVNTDVVFGPHVMFPLGILTMGLQYYFGAKEGYFHHSVRLLAIFHFTG